MSEGLSPRVGEPVDELHALIQLLHQTNRRIEELTGGEVDSVADAQGRPFLLQHAQEHVRRSDEAKQAAILGSLPAHVALLDAQGRIVSVNAAWERFGEANALQSPDHAVGMNYIEICEKASPDPLGEARQVAEGLRSVLSGRASKYSLEYACHSPAERRWFLMTATPLATRGRRGAVVMHVEVTSERLVTEQLLTSEARFRQMADHIDDVFFLQSFDSSQMFYVSPAYERIWGRTCESLYANPSSWADAFHPDDVHLGAEQLDTGGPSFDYEFRIVRPDGEIRWIHVRGAAILDEAGAPYRTAGIASDITDRKAADLKILQLSRVHAMLSGINALIARVRDRDELFTEACRIALDAGGFKMCLVAAVNAAGTSSSPVASAGKDEGLIAAVRELLATDALSSPTMVARSIRMKKPIISNDSQRDPAVLLAKQYAESGVRSLAVLPILVSDRAVGAIVLYSAEVDFFHDDEMRLLTGLADDIAFSLTMLQTRAEREAADEALRSSLKEKEALLKEVHHRVKNNMQVITSLLRLESNRIDHPVTRAVLKDMQNRILAMAALHEALYRSNNFAQVDLAAYLKELIGQLSRSLVADPGKISFRLDLFPVGLELDQAVPCGLIVNELVSNALKHAFPAGRAGEVRVEMQWVGPGLLLLRIRDNGIGLPENFADIRAKSLGLQLVADLARQLGGRLDIGDVVGAAVFEVTFRPEPLTESRKGA